MLLQRFPSQHANGGSDYTVAACAFAASNAIRLRATPKLSKHESR
jgi:hypothetical protein